ncbi:MAG: hypothetical protein AAFY46_00635 [Planctomycetota bacterium]
MNLRTLTATFLTITLTAGAAAQSFDAEALAANLASGETERVQEARDAAVGYLGNPGLSVSDRLAAVSAIDASVSEAVQSDDEFVAVNALLIAGQFVTPSGFQVLTEHLDHETPGVRYAAYRGLRSAFSILADQNAPSLQPAAARSAFERLADAARSEADANTLESAYRALAESLTINAGPLKPLEASAGASLGRIAGDRVSSLDGLAEDDYVLTLGSTLYVALEYRRLLGSAGRRFDDETPRAAATLAGELIGHAYSQFDAAGGLASIDPDRRELLRQTISTAESVAYLALGRLGEQAAETNLAAAFGNGDDRAFRAGVFRIIGPAGSIPGTGVELQNAPSGE